MTSQSHHFGLYAPEKLPYAITGYVNETNRLYAVLNRRLDGRAFVACQRRPLFEPARSHRGRQENTVRPDLSNRRR